MEAKRIAVLAPSGALVLQSGVQNAISRFLASGYTVDVFAVRNEYYEFPDLAEANVYFLPLKISARRESRVWVTLSYTVWLAWKLRSQYVAVFAGGVRALMAASLISKIRPLSIINLQLELYIGPKVNIGLVRIFKYFERKAIRNSWFSIIHDETRAQMLCDDASIDTSDIEIVPNAPVGPGRLQTSDFLHSRCKLNIGSKILLAPGSLGPGFMTEEIVIASQQLRDDWHCVVHSSQLVDFDGPLIQKLVSENVNKRVCFSLEPIPYEQLDDLIGSAHIGLALYGDAGGDNTTQVGLASGKLCHFLKLGVPVIVSDYPVLREFVTDYGVGVVLSDVNKLPDAIDQIEQDYTGYRDRAVAAFDSALAFESHFSKVLERIDKAVSEKL